MRKDQNYTVAFSYGMNIDVCKTISAVLGKERGEKNTGRTNKDNMCNEADSVDEGFVEGSTDDTEAFDWKIAATRIFQD